MKLAVCGVGCVGIAISDGLERLGHEIFRHDLKFGTTIDQVVNFQPEVVFICVPTNALHNGDADTSIVESVTKELLEKHYSGIIAVKSTVPPGTTQKLSALKRTLYSFDAEICFVPEFLRERSAFYDFTEGHGTLIVGVDGPRRNEVVLKLVEAHGRYPTKVISMSTTEAELVKYFNNVYNAARVTFANGFYEVCEKIGADYTTVKNAFISRGVATDMYLDVNKNLRGYAGTCLKKDPVAFANFAASLGVDAQIFRTIVEDNKLYKKTVFEGMRE